MQVTAEEKLQEKPQTTAHSPFEHDNSVIVEPDLEFVRALSKRCGDLYKKCMQCGTCSATCQISPDFKPFPSNQSP